MLQEDRIPKIFISYAWGSSDLVLELAQRLVSHGVDVVLDKWDLKEGQDKYAFMERCVNDPEIGIDWQIDMTKANVLERDLNHPLLKDLEPCF